MTVSEWPPFMEDPDREVEHMLDFDPNTRTFDLTEAEWLKAVSVSADWADAGTVLSRALDLLEEQFDIEPREEFDCD